jgi:hypothetical protein
MLAAAMTVGCGDDAIPGDAGLEATVENVDAILQLSCTFSGTCHGDPRGAGQAMLNFATPLETGQPRATALFAEDGRPKPACEYSAMPLVDPGNPDNSWLMVKIDGPHTGGALMFTPGASWDPGIMRDVDGNYPVSECPLVPRPGEIEFGGPMPYSPVAPMPLPPDEIDLIRRWIAAGAPTATEG